MPCLLEALPYRKDDLTAGYRPEYLRLRDEHDYAVCRVDVRGTGSSDGLATDEYPEQEQRDLAELIQWLADQAWCTGAIGMFGTSYSGFNALHLAAERPPALKAVCAIYSSDDRYTDDVHYMGGSLRLLDVVDYPTYMVAMNALPPVPSLVGDSWVDDWRRRVEDLEPWLVRWVEEQHDSPYWRQGSVRPGYDRIGCPTFVVGGWADGYRNNTFRMVERLRRAGRAAPAADRAVEPHVDRDLAARPAPRPRAGDGALVGPLAAWHRRRVRRRAGAHLVRAAVDPAGAGPSARRGRVALGTVVAARRRRRATCALGNGVVAYDVLADVGHRGVEQLRRVAALGAADGPALRRRGLADLGVAGRRSVAARAPAAAAAAAVVAAGGASCRPSCATSSPTAPRRCSAAGSST